MTIKKITAVFLAVLLCICTLSISASAADTKPVSLDKTGFGLIVGESYTLKAKVTQKCTLQWSTSNKSVATVSKGVVIAKKVGTAKITVKIKGTDKSASCMVYVAPKSNTAKELTKNLGAGINLGNTLDCNNVFWIDNPKPTDYETAWGNPVTTKSMLTKIRKAGFKTVRIPVSWGDHMDSNGKVNKEWMDRVQQVVDYAYDQGLYVILNTHHENWWYWNNPKKFNKTMKTLWQQIAERFKDYDERLIFEDLNEPNKSWEDDGTQIGTDKEIDTLNSVHQTFVDTVRASGGNNKTRFLVIPAMCATCQFPKNMEALKIPNNDKRVLVSVHAYVPYDFALNEGSDWKTYDNNVKIEINYIFDNIKKAYTDNDISVIMGEFGTVDKENTAERVKHTEYFLKKAKECGVPCIWWNDSYNGYWNDGTTPKETKGFCIFNRSELTWYFPEIVEALTGKKVK